MVTKTGLPSTKAADLKDLKNHTTDPAVLEFLDALLDYASVAIINETFIPALENAQQGPDGWHYLFGSFTLGGTITGRLSSSDPNLQNLPATSKYAKLIKSCIVAAPGFLFIGLDFSSLEDRISALTTRDPNKLRVYTDGYDGHSLRAYAYYTEQMPDIDPNSVESINSIQKKYKPLRDKSKNPTFTLTYQGTWKTLVVKYKFTEELAKQVEERYHVLYKVSDDWVADKLNQASKDGYVTAAFGLRVRTPLLAQVVRGAKKTPSEATAEGRSAGNALGQSWCLLNSRAASEFMGKVRREQYRLDIRPCAQIHDAQYYLVPEDPDILAYVNEHLVKAVQWQEDPIIAHDQVKITGELSVFFPSWETEIGIPNGADADQILRLFTSNQEN
jgi:DNA polymerase-1